MDKAVRGCEENVLAWRYPKRMYGVNDDWLADETSAWPAAGQLTAQGLLAAASWHW